MEGSFGWDFPERVTKQVKQAVYDKFTVKLEGNKMAISKHNYWIDDDGYIAYGTGD